MYISQRGTSFSSGTQTLQLNQLGRSRSPKMLSIRLVIILASTIRGRMKRLSSFGFLPSSQAAEAESQDRGKRAKHANSTLAKEGPSGIELPQPVVHYATAGPATSVQAGALSHSVSVFASGSYRRLRMRDRSRGAWLAYCACAVRIGNPVAIILGTPLLMMIVCACLLAAGCFM